MVSFLKRRKGAEPSPSSPAIRHSLSLPDLTTPLLDPASWEEVPSFLTTTIPAPPSPHNRKPSLIGGKASIQFHRPFTPWQVVNAGSKGAADTDGTGDFRTSRVRSWGRDSTATDATALARVSVRRRGKSKVPSKLNVVVVGGKGVGKTSFINLLSDSLKEHIHGNSQSHETPSSPTAPGPPVSPGTTPRSTSARTTRLSSTTLLVDASEWVQLRLIDTPGLELGSEAVQTVLYLIDARTVLHPPTEAAVASELALGVDWSSAGIFDDTRRPSPELASPIEPKLNEVDISNIRRLGERGNVLPVVTHADALTIAELSAVRGVLRHELGEVLNDVFGPIDEEPEAIDEPLSPISTASKPITQAIHAVFNPEVRGRFVRQFPWGQADVMDPDTSDFVALRETILREARTFRSTTSEVLYERYRTERLLAKHASRAAL
ncbi:hypothetical protein EHS25_006525 [Saitozyma podzolica]|uniref:Septin-type G domain-containing protein n=1 Tax=Saitozyma podzolica TaxID=1890683 RepID=A0A427YRX4_9TREE|nr:hypothetical protein EHS25_006525 [Saitozyma podzolica]